MALCVENQLTKALFLNVLEHTHIHTVYLSYGYYVHRAQVTGISIESYTSSNTQTVYKQFSFLISAQRAERKTETRKVKHGISETDKHR